MARVHEVLTELQEHAKALCSIPEDDRVLYYRKISPLILELKGVLRNAPNPFAQEKVVELEWNLTTIARLGDPDGNPDEIHYAVGSRARRSPARSAGLRGGSRLSMGGIGSVQALESAQRRKEKVLHKVF